MSPKMTIDGNYAAAHVGYAFSEICAIYPITPSSQMAELCDEWAAHGRKNAFGQVPRVVELQSEAGAAGALHGALVTGALGTTYTASQGLLLMIPNMYKISGELLPTVFHVSARSLSAHALSIFGDHSDVMACRETGFGMVASCSVQEAMDLGLIAHLSTLKSRVPFLHFFDGFRTSHEVQKIDGIDYETMRELVDIEDVEAFRKRAMNPECPHQRGTAQNPDIYFQGREAPNRFYEALPGIVDAAMQKVSKATGRTYNLFDYVGHPKADTILIAMGSGCETIEETIEHLNAQGHKVGLIKVRLYRPFSAKHFLGALPSTCKRIAVLDRTKAPGKLGEPLYQDVRTVLSENGIDGITVVGGRYGLSSKEFTPSMVKAVVDNLYEEHPKNHFTVGITDDVTHSSLEIGEHVSTDKAGRFSCKFWGLGADGTVGANKNSIKIIGDHTDMYAQGFFVYDSKKSGGITISHLRFGDKPIKSTYLVERPDLVACHNASFLDKYDVLAGIKSGGVFLLNSGWSQEEMGERLPAHVKRTIASKKLRFYNVDAVSIAREVGLGGRINVVMQAAFFEIAGVIPGKDAIKYIKDAIVNTYGRKGEKIIEMNFAAVDRAVDAMVQVDYPETWADALDEAAAASDLPEFVENVAAPILALHGDSLPVSVFSPDGVFPTGTTKYEKRGIAIDVPVWDPATCIQCNQCVLTCPHAVIRPYLLTQEELEAAPEGFNTKPAIGKEAAGMHFCLQVSPLDCTGCGNCVDICPVKVKPLTMKPLDEVVEQQNEYYKYADKLSVKEVFAPTNVKGSQFRQPLFEFSGACGGCGETPYIKLITQLFGDRMIIANATGCSSIYGGTAPTCPYTVNHKGQGPAWGSSLFEDNAEYGYGMSLAYAQARRRLEARVSEALSLEISPETKALFEAWLEAKDDATKCMQVREQVREALEREISGASGKAREVISEIQADDSYFAKPSIWCIGGDGWAYDIGYGGLDHVLASGEDINVLVLDTEVYSNTGGQSSKATPTGAVARFATAGKRTRKKDLGLMMTTYGYIYVAQVALGANPNQLVKAVIEAESYPGPSLVIAYSSCINHGIDMSKSPSVAKEAVESGYWPLYRYDPRLAEAGKNPFVLDSKAPSKDYVEFLRSQTRYTSLLREFPEAAESLFEKASEEAQQRFESYSRLAKKE